MTNLRHPNRLGLRIRIVLAPGVMIGPGRADLLQAVRDQGSISAAGRQLKMSYKRAWDLVDAMNGAFRTPLVEAVTGGAGGGGARLTAAGETVLETYRRLEAKALEHTAKEITILTGLLAC